MVFVRVTECLDDATLFTWCQLCRWPRLSIYFLYPLYGGTLCQFFFGYARFVLLRSNGVNVDGHISSVVSLYHYLRPLYP